MKLVCARMKTVEELPSWFCRCPGILAAVVEMGELVLDLDKVNTGFPERCHFCGSRITPAGSPVVTIVAGQAVGCGIELDTVDIDEGIIDQLDTRG